MSTAATTRLVPAASLMSRPSASKNKGTNKKPPRRWRADPPRIQHSWRSPSPRRRRSGRDSRLAKARMTPPPPGRRIRTPTANSTTPDSASRTGPPIQRLITAPSTVAGKAPSRAHRATCQSTFPRLEYDHSSRGPNLATTPRTARQPQPYPSPRRAREKRCGKRGTDAEQAVQQTHDETAAHDQGSGIHPFSSTRNTSYR